MRTHRDEQLIALAPDLFYAARAMVEALDATKYDVFIGSPSDLQRIREGRQRLVDLIAKTEAVLAL